MIGMITNPGTEASADATLSNAQEVASRILADIGADSVEYLADRDRDGWFGFTFKAGDKSVEVDIPGDDPDTVCEGRPWVSRRLYVDGSSWLYCFAVSIAAERLGLE